jgi:hypothetical protein
MDFGPGLGTPSGTRLPHRAGRAARHPGTPNPDRYDGQRIFVVRSEEYVYLVPFVEDEHAVFLKTTIPSRKAMKEYLGEENGDEA